MKFIGASLTVFAFSAFIAVKGQATENKFECDNGCCNHHEFCRFWQSFGECDRNREWMMLNCQLACKSCGFGSKNRQRPVLNEEQIDEPPELFVKEGPKRFVGNTPSRCNEIMQNIGNETALLLSSEGIVSEFEDVSFRRMISLDEILNSNKQFGCAPQQEFVDCSPNVCFHLRYRSMDGSCNNLQNPLHGAAATPFMRLGRVNYDDGIGAPTASMHGGRPTARQVSRFVLRSPQVVLNNELNTLLMQFGQFVSHDITKTSLLPQDLCRGCDNFGGRCTPIRVEPNDFHPGCQGGPPCCLSFARASPVCGTGNNRPRMQMNENTAFLDGSMVYGSSVTDNNKLRDGPFMRMTPFSGRSFVPFNPQQCVDPPTCNPNLQAGDDRVNIFVGLTAFHTLMLREHNRIVNVLRRNNQRWSPERLFQETRKIVGAELQAITYKEWLPKILGNAFETSIGPYNGYDQSVNPSIASEFTHGAMRFGHGMIPEMFTRMDAGGRPMGRMRFDEGILKPQKLLFEGGIDPVLFGMMTMPVKKPQRITNIVTERMFGNNDLASINLQRGRDAGIPSYNDMREFCGMPRANTFDELAKEILDESMRANLQRGFRSPDSVDLYVGVLSEDPIEGAMVGPTLSCIVGEQFRRIRDGDRFWYQNPGAFTPQQREQLDRASLSRLLCDNSDGIQSVPTDAFHLVDGSNVVPCNSIPAIDLSFWSD